MHEQPEFIYLAGDRIRCVYFPVKGLLSLLSATETGSTAEVAMVGNEGAVGLPVILKKGMMSYEVSVQIPVDAFKIKAEALQEEFDRGERLQAHYSRGNIEILDREALESNSCECYGILRTELDQFLLEKKLSNRLV